MYLVYFLNIEILPLNIDILLDILNNDILSSYWKRGKYKIAGQRGPHDLFGGVGCTTEILMGVGGAGVVDGDSS